MKCHCCIIVSAVIYNQVLEEKVNMIVYFFMFNFIKFFSFANLKLVSCFSVQKKKKKNQKSCLMPFTFPHCKSCINSCNLRCFHFRQKNWNKKKQSYSFVTVQSANQNHLLPGTSVLWNFNTHFIFFLFLNQFIPGKVIILLRCSGCYWKWKRMIRI